ncbi:uncharacterized protein [Hyperolius riggenbachi]|uniref:uncharacterized protein isoform X2 n=1 Tax=Hyperolius riggenbachi TaxID=752182 RepID=UPI0035A2CCD6
MSRGQHRWRLKCIDFISAEFGWSSSMCTENGATLGNLTESETQITSTKTSRDERYEREMHMSSWASWNKGKERTKWGARTTCK